MSGDDYHALARAKKDGPSARQPTPKTFFDDEDFQDHLTSLLVTDPKALADCAHLLSADDFKPLRGMKWGRPRWTCAELALEHYGKHHEPIGKLLKASGLEYVDRIQLGDRAKQEIIDYTAYLSKLKVIGAESIVEKVVRYKQERLRAQALHELVEAQAAGELTDEKFLAAARRVTAAGPVVATENAADLSLAAIEEQRFLLNNILPVGFTLFASKKGDGKTTLLCQLAVAAVRGRPFLGRSVRTPGPVLFAALEDSRADLQAKLRRITGGVAPGELRLLEFLYALPRFPEGISRLESLLEQAARAGRPYAAVFIDPFLAVAAERRGNADLVRGEYQEVLPLKRLAKERNVCVVLSHHTRKAPSADVRDLAIGTGGLIAPADGLWIMTRDPDGDDIKRLHIRGRSIRERTLRVRLGKAGFDLIDEGAEAMAGPAGKQVLALLRKNGAMFPREIAASLHAADNTIRVHLHRLRRRGLVRVAGGKYDSV